MSEKGHITDNQLSKIASPIAGNDSFVLDKGIFYNIFEKDIRRVYIYKKTERLAKAIHLITPAFRNSPALHNKIDAIAVALIDGAVLPPASARTALSRELLALSSLLSLARAGSLISPMNAELISREAQILLGEVADYEEPRLFMEEAPSLAELFKNSAHLRTNRTFVGALKDQETQEVSKGHPNSLIKGQTKDKGSRPSSGRRDAILQVLQKKGPSYIKDISTVIREVSEKTIQRELSALVREGRIQKRGERRWTTYALI